MFFTHSLDSSLTSTNSSKTIVFSLRCFGYFYFWACVQVCMIVLLLTFVATFFHSFLYIFNAPRNTLCSSFVHLPASSAFRPPNPQNLLTRQCPQRFQYFLDFYWKHKTLPHFWCIPWCDMGLALQLYKFHVQYSSRERQPSLWPQQERWIIFVSCLTAPNQTVCHLCLMTSNFWLDMFVCRCRLLLRCRYLLFWCGLKLRCRYSLLLWCRCSLPRSNI